MITIRAGSVGTAPIGCPQAAGGYITPVRDYSMDPEAHRKLDQIMAQIASETGATVHAYPQAGRAVRRVVLMDIRDGGGTRLETAQIEDDGTLRITGHDTGPRVIEFFGMGITSYEWVYVVTPAKVDALLRLLGGAEGDDVLDALATYYQHHGGQLSELLRGPEIAAYFDNWHS